MAEYIDREALRDALYEADAITMRGVAICNQFPAADVVPVVRCRDCKHKGWVQEPEHGKSVDYCRLIERCVDKQFFCAASERKDGDGDV